MRLIALILASILVTNTAGAQEGVGSIESIGAVPSGDGTPSIDLVWGGADNTSLSTYSIYATDSYWTNANGFPISSTAVSPLLINQVPLFRIGNVDVVNLLAGTPGYNLAPPDTIAPPIAIGGERDDWASIITGGAPFIPSYDPLGPTKQIVGPEGASGVIGGLFDTTKYPPATAPPAINFLRNDTTQDAYASACQAAVDALLPFRGQYYETCRSPSGASYGQCRAALRSYVQSCLAFATTSSDASGAPRPADAPPELDPVILSKIAAVSGILFHEASNPADSRIYCTAVRVAKDWILTARHCGFQQKQGGWVSLSAAEIRFIPFDNPKQLFKISSPIDPLQARDPLIYDEEDTSDDYLFFHIDGAEGDAAVPGTAASVGDDNSMSEIATPTPGDRLVLFSFAVTALIDSDQNPATTDDRLVRDGAWTKFMAYDASRTCLVGAMPPPNCLAYPCQAEFVSSGGPLFRITDKDVALVGVHVGHIDPSSGDSCANPQLLGLVNRGVVPRSMDLARLN